MDENYAELARKKFMAGPVWNNEIIILPLKSREALLDQYIKLTVERCEHYKRNDAMLEILLK